MSFSVCRVQKTDISCLDTGLYCSFSKGVPSHERSSCWVMSMYMLLMSECVVYLFSSTGDGKVSTVALRAFSRTFWAVPSKRERRKHRKRVSVYKAKGQDTKDIRHIPFCLFCSMFFPHFLSASLLLLLALLLLALLMPHQGKVSCNAPRQRRRGKGKGRKGWERL